MFNDRHCVENPVSAQVALGQRLPDEMRLRRAQVDLLLKKAFRLPNVTGGGLKKRPFESDVVGRFAGGRPGEVKLPGGVFEVARLASRARGQQADRAGLRPGRQAVVEAAASG